MKSILDGVKCFNSCDFLIRHYQNPLHLQIAIFLSSRDVLQALTSSDLSNDSFPFGTSQVVQLAGHTLRAIRLTFVGELGWELHIPKDSTVDVYHAVMKAGAAHGIINAGYRAIDSLSVEKGMDSVKCIHSKICAYCVVVDDLHPKLMVAFVLLYFFVCFF